MKKKSVASKVKNPDIGKIKSILDVLKQFPDGIWLRELNRRSKVPKVTLSRYLDGILHEFIENVGVKDDNDRYVGLRIVKLKPYLLERDLDITTIKKILETREIIKDIG